MGEGGLDSVGAGKPHRYDLSLPGLGDLRPTVLTPVDHVLCNYLSQVGP